MLNGDNMLWKGQEMILIPKTHMAVFIGLFGSSLSILRCFGRYHFDGANDSLAPPLCFVRVVSPAVIRAR